MITGSGFKSLYINCEEKKLVVNGTEIPFDGLTDFLLTIYHDEKMMSSYWMLDIKRDALSGLCPLAKASSGQAKASGEHPLR